MTGSKLGAITAAVLTAAVLVTVAALPGRAVAAAGPTPVTLPAFYRVPHPLPTGKPGTLIKSERIAVPGVDGTVYRVMYLSKSVRGASVAVTGLVIVPDRPAPARGYPVVSWGHGTNGMAQQCAPSLQPAQDVPLADDLLNQGWEVVASDYQGEGTPGPMPYLVGVDAARNTIDIVQAARHLRVAHAGANYVVWGHSEGGQTAMFALEIGTSYAPDLHMVGVVAGAPPSQFNLIYQFLTTSPYRYYLLMAAVGFTTAYGSAAAPLDRILSPAAMSLVPDLAKGCSGYVQSIADRYTLAELVKVDPFTVPKWSALMKANDPASFTQASRVPLLIIQGADDEQIPVASTQLLAQHECSLGQDLERWIYPGQSHAGVIQPSFGDMVHWIADRFAGVANPDPYMPNGLPAIETTVCPS